SGTVTWSSGQTGSSISVDAVGNYSATCTTNGCVSGSSTSLTLTSCLPASTSGCTSFAPVCSGNSQEMRTVTINVTTAGTYPLSIGYRSPEGNVEGILRINGVSQNLRFNQTNAYATLNLPAVTLKAGDNTIGFSSGTAGGYLCFNSVCVGSGGCTPPAPPTLSASTTQVCPNNAATLTASGCSGTVNWSTGQSGNSIIVTNVGNYSATCTTNDCVSAPSRSLTLITCPALPVSGCTNFAPVCSGNNQEVRTVIITVVKAGNYPLTISYRSPESSVDGIVRINNVSQNLRFSQATSFVALTIASVSLKEGENRIELSSGNSNGTGGGYLCFNSVCAGNGGGCTPPAPPTLSASTTQVCPNAPAVLTASGCNGTITWSTGVTGNSINLNTAGTYSAICTTSNGCSGASSTPITLTTCSTPTTGSCSIDDYSSEINITYKP
ncbi:CBM35 domain-containing protein, partial [Spirosoma arcticum]